MYEYPSNQRMYPNSGTKSGKEHEYHHSQTLEIQTVSVIGQVMREAPVEILNETTEEVHICIIARQVRADFFSNSYDL